MIRPSLYLGVLLLTIPHILISEPTRELISSSELPPIEILFSGITPIDNGASVFLRVDDIGSKLISACPDSQTILRESNGEQIIRWRLTGKCQVPLISYK
jgi:hypothetical protein